MKKQIKYFPIIGKAILVLFCHTLFSGIPLKAQTDIWSALKAWGYDDSEIQMAAIGQRALVIQAENRRLRVPFTGNLVDLKLPGVIHQSYLYLEIKGGDGGGRITNLRHTKGGSGATAQGYFKIGSGENEIAPGATLRFIIGIQGDTRDNEKSCGAYGGGGSGIFLQNAGSSSWRTLLVAGGGGGAFSDCCTIHSEGLSAGTGTNGIEGAGAMHTGGNGGTNGGDGNNTTSAYGGGGGNLAWNHGAPIGSVDIWLNRLYGYGHGGAGSPTGSSGGGGGGYSGGGGGANYGGGGGGGSYVTAEMQAFGLKAIENPKTNSPQNGYAVFEFVTPGTASIQLAKNQVKCVNVEGAEISGGTNISLSDCGNEAAQQWLIDGSCLRMVKDPGKCLDLKSSNTANGANIQLYDCNGTNAQNWIYDVANKMIRSEINFNKCLDLVNGNTANGTNIQLFDCSYSNNQPNQQWTIDGIPSTMPAGTSKSIHLTMVPGKCVDIAQSGTANGTNIQLFDCNGTKAQYFTFDGHAIKMQSSPNKCLDLRQSDTGNGANIQLFDCNGTKAQQWIYDGFLRSFRSAVNISKCIDVDHSGTANGTNIQLWDCNGTNAQQFEIYNSF